MLHGSAEVPRSLAFVLWMTIVLAGCSDHHGEPPEGMASAARVRLLTADQYQHSIAQVFGSEIARSITPPMPPPQRVDGLLASGTASMGLTSDQLAQIQQAATVIAASVVDPAHRPFLLPCTPATQASADSDCARQVLSESGRLLFRRPLTTQRLDALTELAGRGARSLGDFYDGLALAIEALLISPEFLFLMDRVDVGYTDGPARLDAYSVASRLSFMLWNGPPDDALLLAAEAGNLDTKKGLLDQVDRMLRSEYAVRGARAFFDDMLAFDAFNSLAKDAQVYPSVTGRTLADAREQTLLTVVDHLLHREADYRDLFTTPHTFMSPSLAAVYGTPSGQGWTPHTFEDSSLRRGILTHMSFLAAHSHAVRSSPTLRGKALREHLLCQHVPDPPPNVDFSKLDDAGDAATARARLSVHNTNPSCAGCHLITDPIGLSLEQFDGAGRIRPDSQLALLDVSGELDGVFYDDANGLADAVRTHPKLAFCLVRRLYAYGTGGPVSLRYDRPTLEWLEQRFASTQFRWKALLRTLATSNAFTHIRPEGA